MTAQYFPRFDADERVAIYAIWGGIPAYWERLDPAATLLDNIRHELLTANNLMQAEPRMLLSALLLSVPRQPPIAAGPGHPGAVVGGDQASPA